MSFSRRGGLTFWRIGRLGGSFYLAKPAPRAVRSWSAAQTRAENVGLISVAFVTLATLIGG